MENMKKTKYSITQIIRHIIQLASFILFPGLFILTWSSIEIIYKSILAKTFTLNSMISPILTLVAVIPITIFWGRFFCGYICAFGSMQEFLNFIAKKLKIKQFEINQKIDKYLKYIKYVIIVSAIILWTLNIKTDTLSPWNIFGIYSSYKAWTDFSSFLTFGGFLLLLIIICSLFIERVFCRYFCPLGGVFSIISKLRLYKIKKISSKCVNCNLCTMKCPMRIDVNNETTIYGNVESGECIDCFKCIKSCNTQVLYTNSKETLSGTVAAVAITGVYYAGTLAINSSALDNNISTTSLTQGKFSDGVYKGTGQGYRDTITVEVTVSNGNITSITIESHNDDDEFFNKAQNTIINEILSTQSTDVQTVSGATYSSIGIISAVEDALNITDTTVSENNMETDVENNTDNKQQSNYNNSDTNINYDFSQLEDGTYEGVGIGRNGDINVSVVVIEGKVTSITIESSQEDKPYRDKSENIIINEIITNQTLDVQTVGGATMTSNGIIDAVANALDISFENPNEQIQTKDKGMHGGKHERH